VNRRWAEAALVLNTVVWGATFVLVKAALLDISPLLFLALRFSLATGALLALFCGSRWVPFTGKAVAAGGLPASFSLRLSITTLGLRLTTAPKSAFITGLLSVMVPLLAALVYRNRPQVSEVAGVLVATAGLGLMTLEGGAPPRHRPGRPADVFLRHWVRRAHRDAGPLSENMRFQVLSIAQVGAAALLALSLFWWAETPHVRWRPAVICAILVTGLLATALAFTIQAWAQQYTTSTRTGLIYMLEPVFAWITSYCNRG